MQSIGHCPPHSRGMVCYFRVWSMVHCAAASQAENRPRVKKNTMVLSQMAPMHIYEMPHGPHTVTVEKRSHQPSSHS
eukprot:SAG11_NODE_33086_length_279_cov_0.616667_1_plen_76_part_10